MNEQITTEVIAMIEKKGWQDIAKRVHGINGIAPAQHCCGGGNLETKIAEPYIVASRGRGEQNKQHLEPRNDGLTNAITTVEKDNYVVEKQYRIRKLTPKESFRLMGCDEPTIDTLLSAGISNSQLYKLAGNSIVVDVLTAIFDKIFVNTKQEIGQQLQLF